MTSHGYGHAARSLEVMRRLPRPLRVVTKVEPEFFRPLGAEICPGRFDVGLVQKDSVRGDVTATLGELQRLQAEDRELREAAAELLRGARLVVVDAPALPLGVARQLGIPALAVTNFLWDFIYEPFAAQDAAWVPVLDWFRTDYSHATAALRYPFSAPMPIIENHLEIPLVASPGRNRRDELAKLTGADPARPWAAVWFHQLSLENYQSLAESDFQFFSITDLNWKMPNYFQVHDFPFADMIASCDAVVSKPGFGIVSDCLANRKPFLHVPRDDFREAALLVEGLRRHLACVRVEQDRFYRGEWAEDLAAMLSAPCPGGDFPEVNGATRVADTILSFL